MINLKRLESMYDVMNMVTENVNNLMKKMFMIYCNHYKTCCHFV